MQIIIHHVSSFKTAHSIKSTAQYNTYIYIVTCWLLKAKCLCMHIYTPSEKESERESEREREKLENVTEPFLYKKDVLLFGLIWLFEFNRLRKASILHL